MSVLTTTILKYSLVAIGIGTSAVVPLVYSSAPTEKLIGDKHQKRENKKSTVQPKLVSEAVEDGNVLERTQPEGKSKENLEMSSTKSLQELKQEIKVSRESRSVLPPPDLSVKHPVDQKVDIGQQQKAYQEFVFSIWNILRSTLWVDEKFGTPWIFQVNANIPSDKLGKFLKYGKVQKGIKDDELKNSTISAVELSLTKEDIQNMKKENTKELVKPKREDMYNLFSKFCFSPNWEESVLGLDSEIKQDNFKSRQILCSFGGISSQTVENVGVVNTLTFVRNYNDKLHFLDIFFNTKNAHNQLVVQYVSYKDNSWWSSGYYQANGEYDNYKRYIGGDIKLDSDTGASVTRIDKDFASMFKGSSSDNQESLYRLFSSISKCLLDNECSIMFHREKDDFQELAQRTPGISKSDSWREEVYRSIHPFSRKYWEIDKKMKENPRIYSQFLDLNIENMKVR